MMSITETRTALRIAELNEGTHQINGMSVVTKIVRKPRTRPYSVYMVDGKRTRRLDLVYMALRAADKS